MIVKFNVVTLLFLFLCLCSAFITYIFWRAKPSKLRSAMLHYFCGATWINLIFTFTYTYLVFGKPTQIKAITITNIATIPFLIGNIVLFGYFFVNYFWTKD